MFAVTIRQNGEFVKFVGFAKDKEQVEEFEKAFVNKFGEEFLNENGYKLYAELAI